MIVFYILAALISYIFLGSITAGILIRNKWANDMATLGGIFWPITLVVLACYATIMLVSRPVMFVVDKTVHWNEIES